MNKFSFKVKILGLTIFCIEIDKLNNYEKENSTTNINTKLVEEINQTKTQNIEYKGSVRPDLKDLEKKLNPTEENLPMIVTCGGCGATTYDNDLNICSCGRTICSVCGSFDPQSARYYCKECWEKI